MASVVNPIKKGTESSDLEYNMHNQINNDAQLHEVRCMLAPVSAKCSAEAKNREFAGFVCKGAVVGDVTPQFGKCLQYIYYIRLTART